MEIPRDVREMSSEELMFYYFKMYDADQNTKGRPIKILEILKPGDSGGGGGGSGGGRGGGDDGGDEVPGLQL